MQNKHAEKSQITRKNHILELINKNGYVKVSDLSATLNASAVTIRKDLEKMESEGLLVRTHGGAKGIESVRYENHQQEKQAIAAAAAALVNDGDFIFINSGSTCLYVCEALKAKKNLTVVTNSVQILTCLIGCASITTFFLGGKVDTDMQITTGDDAAEQLSRYVADKVFLGMDGVDAAMGATTYNHTEEAIMRQMLQQAKEKILIADHSKIGRVTFARIAALTEFDTLITNRTEENAVELAKIRAMGMKVICTE